VKDSVCARPRNPPWGLIGHLTCTIVRDGDRVPRKVGHPHMMTCHPLCKVKKPGHRCTVTPCCKNVAGRTATTKGPPIEIDATDPVCSLVVLGDPEGKRPRCRRAGSACGDDAETAKGCPWRVSPCYRPAQCPRARDGSRISSDFRRWSEVPRQGRAPRAFLYAAWYPVRRTARDPSHLSRGRGLTHPYSVIGSVEAELEHSPRLVAWPILFQGLAFESGREPADIRPVEVEGRKDCSPASAKVA